MNQICLALQNGQPAIILNLFMGMANLLQEEEDQPKLKFDWKNGAAQESQAFPNAKYVL